MVLAPVLRFGRMSVDEDLGLGFGVLAPRFGALDSEFRVSLFWD